MDLIERLAAHRTLAATPRQQLAWVASHGRLLHFAPGETVLPKTGPVEGLYVVLSGHLSIRIDRGAGPRRAMEWRAGDVTGLLPYSRLVAPPGNVVAEEPTEAVLVGREHFSDMIRECYELTSILVRVMIDRARHFTSSDLHDEKMLSLGKLAAGLAHELNNPASAVARSSKALADSVAEAESASRALGAAQLSETQLVAVDKVRETCLAPSVKLLQSPVERADREDALAGWLERHASDPTAAESLAESVISLERLDHLAEVLDGATLDLALRWVAAVCTTRRLASEIETAASRIHTLVAAVKGFTYMDQSTVPMPVDVGRGLADTLAVLKAKARAKSVGVTVTVEPELPWIQGFGGELNQIWVNLLDNALDAASDSGHVEVRATQQPGSIVVSVIDDGPGIPAEIRERIFDPFFTTKPIGHGTGLGLDIVRRLVHRHSGEIDVDSRSGRTEFRVTLPTASSSHGGAP